MPQKELIPDLTEVLRETADKFQPELFQRVAGELRPRDLRLLGHVFKRYYQKDEMGGRWYDPYHILFSTCFAVQLAGTHSQASSLIISAIILHDIGYRTLTNEAKANWNATQIGEIVGMVASHDNIYLDILTEQDPNRLAVRDADRMWVMHFISFYKDWVSGPEDMSLTGLLKTRKDSIRGVKGPVTELAQECLSRQFRMRSREISADIIRNKDVFRQYVERHIRAELKAGRG